MEIPQLFAPSFRLHDGSTFQLPAPGHHVTIATIEILTRGTILSYNPTKYIQLLRLQTVDNSSKWPTGWQVSEEASSCVLPVVSLSESTFNLTYKAPTKSRYFNWQKLLSVGTTPDLLESMNKSEMWAVIQEPETRLTYSLWLHKNHPQFLDFFYQYKRYFNVTQGTVFYQLLVQQLLSCVKPETSKLRLIKVSKDCGIFLGGLPPSLSTLI